jgi:hypothetical protein
MCEYCTITNFPTATKTTITTKNLLYKCDGIKQKLIELLKQPSIAELNERLDKILTSTKYETRLNETLKQTIKIYLNDFYRDFTIRRLEAENLLNNKKNCLNSMVYSLISCRVKIRSDDYKKIWYENLIDFEKDLNFKQNDEICKLNRQLNGKKNDLDKLNDCFKNKQLEIDKLKSNLNELNENYTNLTENLFETKHVNLDLKDSIGSLKREIDFYKSFDYNNNKKSCLDNSLNLSLDSNIGSMCSNNEICLSPSSRRILSSSTSSIDSNIQLSEFDELTPNDYYYKNELSLARAEIRAEYEVYMNLQLDCYEDEVEADFYLKLDANELEFEEMNKKFDDDYDELINELQILNEEYLQNLNEFIQLNNFNSSLSERLVVLSENLLKFSKSSSSQCELIMLKYSMNTLRRHINENKIDVEKTELKLTNLKNLLFNKNIDYILNENLLLKSIKTIIPIKQLRSMLNMSSNLLSQQQIFEVLYTQTNLFGYIQFNFNLNHKTSSIRVLQNKIDTSVLIIENLDKVLDLDLSEWMLKREIYSALKITKSNSEFDQIEFKFPKGFKLKRRKKLVLLSASANLSDYQAVLPTSVRKGVVKTGGKENILQSKSKDTDLYYCGNVPNWGCGLQIVTKLLNNKNMTKYVNYRSFKSIWSNLV